jgi:hypothetical protein
LFKFEEYSNLKKFKIEKFKVSKVQNKPKPAEN